MYTLCTGDGAGVDKGSVWEEGESLNAVSSSQVVTAIHQGGAKYRVKTLIFTGTRDHDNGHDQHLSYMIIFFS